MESVKRDKYIKVYVVQEEKAAIEERANATGLTCSNYLRSCGLKQLIGNKPSTDAIALFAPPLELSITN